MSRRRLLKTYTPYHRETYIGQRPALLAIDLYNLAYEGGAKEPHELVDTYKARVVFMRTTRSNRRKSCLRWRDHSKIPVFYTTTETRKEAKPGAVHATQSPAGQDRSASVRDQGRVQTANRAMWSIFKERASGTFSARPLVAHLTQLGVDSLIVCGESTSGCVRASCVDGYSLGYHVSIVEECVFDRSPLSHKVNLFDMHHKYTDVMKPRRS